MIYIVVRIFPRSRSMLIATLMKGLAASCPIFLSEAEFQHEPALRVRKITPKVRLEFSPFQDERMSLDVWLPDMGIAIELKWGTQKLKVKRDDGDFVLVNQGAQPLLRYDFVKDVSRLERVIDGYPPADAGFAVLLTNDSSYWKPPRKKKTIDTDFRIHEGAVIEGVREWSPDAATGTIQGRESPIGLRGSYECRWRDYLRLGEKRHGMFRYLAMNVHADSAS